MSIMNELDRQLGMIANTAASPPYPVEVTVNGGRLQCALAALDSIGCSVDHLRLTLDDQHRWQLSSMRALAERLCQQLRYLVEPLQVIEVDSDEPLVQARSQPPSRDAARNVSYYELLVSPQNLSLVRFSARRGEPRHTIAMQLTREILRRLVQDVAEAV